MAIDLNNQDLINGKSLTVKTITAPLSPTVFANNQPVVIKTAPSASDPSPAAGSSIPVPLTDTPIQIGADTYAQNGVVYYAQTANGAKLAAGAESASMGAYGPIPHELPSGGAPVSYTHLTLPTNREV